MTDEEADDLYDSVNIATLGCSEIIDRVTLQTEC